MTATGAGPEPPEREAWTGEYRVTVDLDDADPLDVVRTWHGLTDAGAYDVEARVSASGEGFHVRAWVDADEWDEQTVECMRLAVGDHPRRVWMDREHVHKPAQVLFSRKPTGEAGPWRPTPWRAAQDLQRRSDRHSTGWPSP